MGIYGSATAQETPLTYHSFFSSTISNTSPKLTGYDHDFVSLSFIRKDIGDTFDHRLNDKQ